MDKVLVVVYVPFIEEKYELYIPINKKIGTIRNLIIKSINEMSDNILTNNQVLRLYSNDTGDVLPNNIFVKDCNIVNGTTLVLI